MKLKKIYEAQNPIQVWNARRIVEDHGIRGTILNEFAGGASGALSPLDAWPELWVSEFHAERARRVLHEASLEAPGHDWKCRECTEANAAPFEVCWNCGAPPASVALPSKTEP